MLNLHDVTNIIIHFLQEMLMWVNMTKIMYCDLEVIQNKKIVSIFCMGPLHQIPGYRSFGAETSSGAPIRTSRIN